MQKNKGDIESDGRRSSPLSTTDVRKIGGHDRNDEDAVKTLRELQEEYREWLDNLPESLRSSSLAEKLEEVCSLDLDQFR